MGIYNVFGNFANFAKRTSILYNYASPTLYSERQVALAILLPCSIPVVSKNHPTSIQKSIHRDLMIEDPTCVVDYESLTRMLRPNTTRCRMLHPLVIKVISFLLPNELGEIN